jgi:hypothetical protein
MVGSFPLTLGPSPAGRGEGNTRLNSLAPSGERVAKGRVRGQLEGIRDFFTASGVQRWVVSNRKDPPRRLTPSAPAERGISNPLHPPEGCRGGLFQTGGRTPTTDAFSPSERGFSEGSAFFPTPVGRILPASCENDARRFRA